MFGKPIPSGVRKSLRHSLYLSMTEERSVGSSIEKARTTYRTPRTGESAVKNTALHPCLSASCSTRFCNGRSFNIYICIACPTLGPASRTSLAGKLAKLDIACGTFFDEQARDVANSPSGCASACMPAGAQPNGKAILWPKHDVEVSAFDTSINTRLRTRYLLYAVLFSWMVL